MDFYIANPERSTDLYLSIKEVRPGIAIMQARINDFNLLPVAGDETGEGQQTVFPNMLQ